MGKKLTESHKYRDPWYRQLAPKMKLMYDYLYHECDHGGVWEVDLGMAAFMIGYDEYDEAEIIKALGDRIKRIDDNRWYLTRYIINQYKCDVDGLNPRNNFHKAALERLSKIGITQTQTSPSLGALEMDKEKNKEKVKKTVAKPVRITKAFHKPTIEEVKQYCIERNNKVPPEAFINHYESNGWKVGKNSMKDWKAAVRTWERTHGFKPKKPEILDLGEPDPENQARVSELIKQTQAKMGGM